MKPASVASLLNDNVVRPCNEYIGRFSEEKKEIFGQPKSDYGNWRHFGYHDLFKNIQIKVHLKLDE